LRRAPAKAAQDKFGGRIDISRQRRGRLGPDRQDRRAETTLDEFDEIVTLNMGGCFNTMHACCPP
jgi:3-oxoacyl-[acyl-carrier protein] reductase